jgi:hypothetical protein
MRPVAVVVRDEDAEHLFEVPSAEDQGPVEAFGTGGADEALGDSVRAWRANRRISRLSLRKTASKLRLNLLSRSWMRKRSDVGRSDSDQGSWRACWVTQELSGFALQPARWTRRLSSSMKNKTYKRLRRTVSTVKKVGRDHALCLCAQERAPREAGAFARWA